MVTDTTSRILRLLGLLQTHRFWPGAELAERLGVSARTLRRDVDRLRELDYPIQATPGTGGGYKLELGASVPPLVVDDDEATAMAIGLSTAAGGGVADIEESSERAVAKLEQLLPSRLRHQVAAVADHTMALLPAVSRVAPDVLVTLARACRDHELLRFLYRKRDGSQGERLVEPHSLVAYGRRWYLVAWDVDRDDFRTFRLDRLSEPKLLGHRVAPRELPEGDAAEHVAKAIQTTIAQHRAVVTIYAPVEMVLDRAQAGLGELEALDDTSCRLYTQADSLQWLALSIGMLDFDFEIHEPPELIDYIRVLIGRWSQGVAGHTGVNQSARLGR